MGKRTLLIAVSALALTELSASAENAPKMGKKEIKTLIGSAKAAADHQKLATYIYRAEAARLQAKQQEHEEEAAEYFKDPSSHPVPEVSDPWPALS
jgi:hypothetical protein